MSIGNSPDLHRLGPLDNGVTKNRFNLPEGQRVAPEQPHDCVVFGSSLPGIVRYHSGERSLDALSFVSNCYREGYRLPGLDAYNYWAHRALTEPLEQLPAWLQPDPAPTPDPDMMPGIVFPGCILESSLVVHLSRRHPVWCPYFPGLRWRKRRWEEYYGLLGHMTTARGYFAMYPPET